MSKWLYLILSGVAFGTFYALALPNIRGWRSLIVSFSLVIAIGALMEWLNS